MSNTSIQTNNKNFLDLAATRLAEIKLSELGFRYIPGIYPIFKRFRHFIEVKARIVKPKH